MNATVTINVQFLIQWTESSEHLLVLSTYLISHFVKFLLFALRISLQIQGLHLNHMKFKVYCKVVWRGHSSTLGLNNTSSKFSNKCYVSEITAYQLFLIQLIQFKVTHAANSVEITPNHKTYQGIGRSCYPIFTRIRVTAIHVGHWMNSQGLMWLNQQ